MSELSNLNILKVLSQQIVENILQYKKKEIEINTTENFRNKIKKEILKNKNEDKIIFKENKEIINDEKDIKIIEKIFEDLKSIKQTLINSSKDIKIIFNDSLQFLKDEKGKKVEINFEIIHKEQFKEKIINDDFIKFLFLIIINSKNPKLDYLKQLYKDIEIESSFLNEEKKKFDTLINYNIFKINEKKKKISNKKDIQIIINNQNKKTSNLNTITNENYKILSKSNEIILKEEDLSKKNKINKKKKKNIIKTGKEKDIKEFNFEQLYQYIQTDDDKFIKSKKKKNKKNKNQNQIEGNLNINSEEEKEINLIKQNLLNNSCNKYSIRKIKPNLNKEWLNKIKFISNNIP